MQDSLPMGPTPCDSCPIASAQEGSRDHLFGDAEARRIERGAGPSLKAWLSPWRMPHRPSRGDVRDLGITNSPRPCTPPALPTAEG